MPGKATPAKLDNAVQVYMTGKGLYETARIVGLDPKTVRAVVEQRGVRRSVAEQRALAEAGRIRTLVAKSGVMPEEVAARYSQGESVLALARSFRVSRMLIIKRLEMAGVEIRDPTAANRLMMSKRTPAENRRNTEAAHAAVKADPTFGARIAAIHKGRVQPWEARCKGALTREKRGICVSPAETLLGAWLFYEFDIQTIPQKAVGPYNVDLAAEPVAVEVFGGGWHAAGDHARRSTERMSYILDQGWNLMIVWVNLHSHPLRIDAARHVAAFVEESRRDPSARREYRVIWGDGHVPPGPRPQLDDLARVPASARRHKRAA